MNYYRISFGCILMLLAVLSYFEGISTSSEIMRMVFEIGCVAGFIFGFFVMIGAT